MIINTKIKELIHNKHVVIISIIVVWKKQQKNNNKIHT